MKSGDSPKEKKYTRREAIKYSAKIGLGATIYGTLGNMGGRVYRFGRDAYRNNVKPAVKKIEDAADKINNLNPFGRKPVETPEPKMTRRGLLRYLASQAHEHPVTAGTTIGAAYGAGKYSLRHLSTYLTKRQIAILKDENASYKERLDALEKYKENLETAMKRRDENFATLEDELGKVRKILRETTKKPSQLEAIFGAEDLEIEEGDSSDYTEPKRLIARNLGIFGLIASVVLSSITLTGNSIISIAKVQSMSLSVALFVISLVFIWFGLKEK